MLAPEVWAFEPPSKSLKIKIGTLQQNRSSVHDLIGNHYFNHLVSVILPDTSHVPDSISGALTTDCEYYKVTDLPPHELIEKDFIEAFVKKGNLTLLSIGTHIDVDDCLALTPAGTLIFSLCRESYQKLGLGGKPTLTKNKEPQRYVVSLDLAASHFAPGKKNYERAYSCLLHRLQSRFDVVLSWDSPGSDICPSSVAAYLSDRGYNIEVCRPKFEQRREYNVAVPCLSPLGDTIEPQEFLEWLGVISLGIDCDPTAQNEFLSDYACPDKTLDCGQVAVLTWSGLLTTSKVLQLYRTVSEFCEERETLPWASLYIQGFTDSPISWKQQQHSFFTDGDNSLTVVIQPDGSFLSACLQSNVRMLK